MQHKEQLGFLTFARNSETTDYLRLAYAQALNVKATQNNARYAVVVDTATLALVTEQHRKVFDYVIEYNSTSAFEAEAAVFWLTPFKETIKVESDLLFTGSIQHWLPLLRLRDVVLSTGCKNYLGQTSTVRKYRKLFDDNALPDTYNGLMYFRFSKTATDFFTLAMSLQRNWADIRDSILVNCREPLPSTDVLYAVTAKTIGPELCTIPSADFINFTHMKPGIQGWSDNQEWFDTVMSERDGDIMRINHINQLGPVHYYDKNYVTDELIKYYEHRLGLL